MTVQVYLQTDLRGLWATIFHKKFIHSKINYFGIMYVNVDEQEI